MREKLKTFIKEYAIVCIALALFLSLGAVTLADYVKSSRTMRVVAAYGEQFRRFSSNYLAPGDDPEANQRTIHFSASTEDTTERVVTICNHPQGDTGSVSDTNINYSLTAQLKVYDESTGLFRAALSTDFTGSGSRSLVLRLESDMSFDFFDSQHITNGEFANYSVTAPSVLPAYVPTDHSLHITHQNAAQSCSHKLFLAITVQRTDNGSTDSLVGLIQLSTDSVSQPSQWTGAFEWDGDTPISNYDGFNYTITGYGAPAGRFTLRWDPAKLTLNRAFVNFTLAKQYPNDSTHYVYTPASGSVTLDTLTFDADSNNVARYDLQFYPVKGADLTGNAQNLAAQKAAIEALVTFAPAPEQNNG